MSCNNVNVEPIVIGGGDGSTAYDAFGRLRVSNPLTIFDSKNVMSKNSLFDESLTGSGTVTYTSDKSTVNLNVTTASGDKVIRQSKRVMSYQPGKSLLILNTFVMNAQESGLEQRVGTFDANNGIFFEDTGTGYQIVRRTYVTGSAVDNDVAQSSWNGDKLDGTGESGYTLDPTKATILFTDYEWLGMGAVRVGFVIDGKFITAHTFLNANSLSTVYMQTANLPIRYEIETTGTISGAATLQQVCSTCMIEGGYAPGGLRQSIGTASLSGVNLTTAGTYYNLATIRIKSSRPYAVIVPIDIAASAISNSDFQIELRINATPSTAFSYTSYSDNVEYDLTGSTTITGGTVVGQAYLSGKGANNLQFATEGFNFDYQLGQTIGGTSDTLTLCAKGASNGDDICGTLKWVDLT
tara:strand:- start:2506 stop:3735 length:1230 start_codon:yes stop_codon:yes gene_type:complete